MFLVWPMNETLLVAFTMLCCSYCVRFGIGIIVMFLHTKYTRHETYLIYVTSTQHELTIIKFPILVGCLKAATMTTATAVIVPTA